MGKNKRKSFRMSLYRSIANALGMYQIPKDRIPSEKEFIKQMEETEKRSPKSSPKALHEMGRQAPNANYSTPAERSARATEEEDG